MQTHYNCKEVALPGYDGRKMLYGNDTINFLLFSLVYIA